MNAPTLQLRPDVAAAVQAAVVSRPNAEWDDYEAAKQRIIAACGRDAPAERFDQEQYDLAIASYLNAVNL